MKSERSRAELTVGDDPRLVPAVGGIVSHVAQRAGLSATAQQELADAAESACRRIFPLLNGRDPLLKLVIEDFSDRVEVTLEHSGPLEAPGSLGTGEGEYRDGLEADLFHGVDCVRCETTGSRSRMTLIRYVRNPAAKS